MCKFIATLYQDAAGTTNVPLRDFRIHNCSIGEAWRGLRPLQASPVVGVRGRPGALWAPSPAPPPHGPN